MRIRAWLTDERRWLCLVVALAIGVSCGRLAMLSAGIKADGASDFTVYFEGARAVLAGINPWHNPAFGPGHPFPYSEPLFYPLPTLLFLVPLAWLPLSLAAGVFVGLSAGLLAYAVMRSERSRLLLFLSPPFIDAVVTGQWSPLMLAAMLLPGLSALWWLKPNYGVMAFIARPRLKGALLMGAVGLLGLLLVPTWPLDWLHAMGQTKNPLPITVGAAPLLLLAALCWRRPEGRFLLALAFVPHLVYWYDGVLLWCLPRSWRQSALLLAGSVLACAQSFLLTGRQVLFAPPAESRPLVIAGIYLPALGILLWQEREQLAALWQRGRTRLAGRLAAAH